MFSSTQLIILIASLANIITAAPAPAPAGPIAAPATYVVLGADISQPWSTIQGKNPEHFSFTMAGQWPGALPVACTLDWNAGLANVTGGGDIKIDVEFNNCTDTNVVIKMTRFRVEPWFLWELTVTAPGFNPVTWRMKNMYETKGWTVDKDATAWHFDGGAGHPISGAPSGTLTDCLRSNTCVSN